VEILARVLFEILPSLFIRYSQNHKVEPYVWKLLGLLEPGYGPFWKLNRVIVQLIVKLPLISGCFSAYLQTSSSHLGDDQTLIWRAVLLLIGSGSALAIISPSGIASKLVESQIPGRIVFSSYIGTPSACYRACQMYRSCITNYCHQLLFLKHLTS
jgi:hypothetical protein